MDLKKFEENLDLSITAAMIGISKQNWMFAKPEDTMDQAKQVMRENSFDILPIQEKDGTVDHYFKIVEPGNYETIQKSSIKYAESIYYLTDLKDLLRIFNNNFRAYYFLTNHSEIVGLVSTVNLNSKPVYVYFYNLLSKLEIELGLWIKALLPEKVVLKFLNTQVSKKTGANN